MRDTNLPAARPANRGQAQTGKDGHSIPGQRNQHTRAIIALGVVSFFWGTTWVASRQGVQHMPALQLAAIRQLLAGILYVLYFLFRGTPWPRAKQWINILILSLLNLVITNGLTTLGVKYISAGLGAIIAAIFPLWIVVFGLFRSQSAMPRKAVIGLLLGFGGVCIIFFEHLKDFLNADFRFGIAVSLIASVSWAFGTLYTKSYAQAFNPYFNLGLQMVIASVLLFGVSAAGGNQIPIKAIPWQSWVSIAYLVLIGSVTTFAAYLYAIQHLPMGQFSIYAYMNPVVAVLMGAMLFSEKLTWYLGLGALVTLLGIYLVNATFRKGKNQSIAGGWQDQEA